MGAGSTVLAYLAVAASGSEGLAQLGVFSAVGVGVALLVSMTLLPQLLDSSIEKTDTATAVPVKLQHFVWPLVLMLGSGVLFVADDQLWSDDLSALTPLPAATLERDKVLRAEFGAPDIRYLLLLQSADREELLAATESVTASLRQHGGRQGGKC